MLNTIRQNIIHQLWLHYHDTTPEMRRIKTGLAEKQLPLLLDHFAIIDLPGPRTGIAPLSELFSLLGYEEKGRGYLPEKQNDFLWMSEVEAESKLATEVMPQAVVADFRLDEMPLAVRDIIYHYAIQASPLPMPHLSKLAADVEQGNEEAGKELNDTILTYLQGRDWSLPSTREFYTVKEFNELLAWVLVFGRRVNHFTLSIHLLNAFNNLTEFHRYIVDTLELPLNEDGGIIKGSQEKGIEQASTKGMIKKVELADGEIELPTGFVEFVWRHPAKETPAAPSLWQDYFTGFIANQANHVIQSLYLGDDLA